MENTNPYADIINLSRPVSKYPPMPMEKRAAQFSPFAALTGHSAAIREAVRPTEEKRELGEDTRTAIGQKLYLLEERQGGQPEITVTYFLPDGKKQGGQYARATGRVRKVDVYDGQLIMADGARIPFEDIVELEGEVFEEVFGV